VAIIVRIFWPTSAVVGESLLRFSEELVRQGHQVSVITQDHSKIKSHLHEHHRGEGIKFYLAKAFTTSASRLLSRVLDAIFFMFWVIFGLIRVRPNRVYVSTDPPVIVPFIVALYCKIFRAEYIYHLQDIHPEAANIIIPMKDWVFKTLIFIDSITMRGAHSIISITQEMAEESRRRSKTQSPIYILDNPSVSFQNIKIRKKKIKGFAFCGNAGRLQRIPLVLEAIEQYFKQGGTLPFVFAGGGVYADQLKSMNDLHEQFIYHGLVSADEAAQINADYEWALLPIDDKVTRFAFPSKLSSYVVSGAKVMAISSEETSVAHWVRDHKVGVVVQPDVDQLTEKFFEIEKGSRFFALFSSNRRALKRKFDFDVFTQTLMRIILS
jgi:glycosyltransferase involved in cell wall biosynthesis